MEMKKKRYLLVAFIFALICAAGTITAFYSDSNTKVNHFTVGENTSEITEVFTPPEQIQQGDRVTKEVKVKNTGMPSFARVFIAISDDAMAKKFTINFNKSDWTKDGEYYYYNHILATNESTTALFDTLSFEESLPKDSGLEVTCLAETVQAEGFSSAKEAFAAFK